jgi:hypothetical protein
MANTYSQIYIQIVFAVKETNLISKIGRMNYKYITELLLMKVKIV